MVMVCDDCYEGEDCENLWIDAVTQICCLCDDEREDCSDCKERKE